MDSTSSSRNRTALEPKRDLGRRRVAALLRAAALVFQERGFEAATMVEIAARAEANIGSLYRFFPNKEALADALMQHYTEVLQQGFEAIAAQARTLSPEALSDLLIDFLVARHAQTRALSALLDSRAESTLTRLQIRAQALAGVKAALVACAPHLGSTEADAESIAAVVLNNMKTMVGMTLKDAPTSAGAPDELRFMNRLYLAQRLGVAR
ncbi:TetR/AcrR family transcriptional regulator [Acetobacter farinalis]|uniref:TetR/AcrR family transcriptional regulator n=1 Tax=Acetobacter farinalis TaxID=1260984 RepID=A0ABT3Q7D5_9PROT|nr:TetR/AcrR family transcriptional regulator [Acetobacter farinalis]MCX2561164.1 TetR/AcrR family transcriptional regulator [Acetobacter farinalis]NHO29866.1 TetR family transcriptional regulator [Acetobacter farinalis]